MATSRLDQLIQYYKEDPNDPFNIYALALEYGKSDTASSRKLFDELLTSHENYLPAYYHAGKLSVAQGEHDKAIAILEKGILLARKQNDLKAARELRSFLDEISFE